MRLRHDDPALDALGAEVRRRRIELGLTQDVLGERAGIHRNYVGMLERGERNATVLTLLRVAGGLGVPASSLLEAAQHGGE
ncbi:MAG: helix-turn-helix transcriptional regulator [Solirubrobacteraceae bacterium]